MRRWLAPLVGVLLALALVGGVALPVGAQGEAQTAAQAQGWTLHTVQPGETVSGIALHYGVTASAIINANGLRPPYTIYVGQTLRIPRTAPTPTYYTVKRGDTVNSIARQFGVTAQALIATNGLRPPYTIYPGQTLQIPGGGQPGPGPGPRYHVVRPGDTLIRIGQQYGVPWGDIAVANGLSYPFILYVGQVLTIPGGGGVPTPTPGPRITILSPAADATVTSPVRVSGWGRAAFEQTLVIRILDAGGRVVGQQPVIVQSEIGQPGPFSADVPFTIPIGTQNGRIEVVDYSPRDGSVLASASVNVRLRR
ncbi:MAG: LysM peptidoglycan-binding domain-containing protein [Anaerolineae bacterium]|nr:LysM peptidoglycan-binding domain-containing protein [Anaerolineae bacterium]